MKIEQEWFEVIPSNLNNNDITHTKHQNKIYSYVES